MTHVHYKFSSKLSYDTVLFDGPHITLRDLKRQIMGREKLRAGDCDLQITNAQSKEEYTDDEGLIPKGSSVIVRRIPVCGGRSSSNSKTNNVESSAVAFHYTYGAAKAMAEQSSSRALPFLAKMANLAEADVSEEDKIKVMLNQSTYDAMNYNKRFGPALPANYTCYRCGNTGHHIRSCPTSGQDKNFEAPLRIRKSTGIPRSFMVEVDDPNMKGAMLTNTGRYAIPAIDAEAYAIGKKEKPPFIPQEKPASKAEEDPVPDELLCLICRDLLSDAVVIPCCGNSYCDDCVRTTLLDSEDHICPTCSQSDVSPDTLIANKFLRQAVNNFKKERGYTKTLKTGCGASQSQTLTTRSSLVTTQPPMVGQSQPQRPHPPTSSEQVNQHQPQVADTLPLSEAPPAAPGLTSACSTPGTSIQPEQSCQERDDKKPEEKTPDDSAALVAAPSVLVSNQELSPAPPRHIPVVNHTAVAEQPETICVKQQPSSSLSAAPSPCGPPTSWDSSSSGHPSRGWTENSSAYSATTPPLFPSPIFLSPHQSHGSVPPGYQPTPPLWPVPSPHGTPIPSLCSSMPTFSIPSLSSSTSTSFIPSLIPDEWYRHQRKKNERGASYGDPTSRSKSHKPKSSRSYSNSSSRSRSRSRSRSNSRSRHQSPYSHHRNLHTRSHAISSYGYGYKCSRSPTPSSSSSPRVSHSSRSKSPSDHQKKRHHGRHQNKKSSSSRYSSRRRGDRPLSESGGSEARLASPLSSSMALERERYLQWKEDYKEWCEKYFSSYVSHVQQLPLPLLNLPPPPPPHWEDRGRSENSSHAQSGCDDRPQGTCSSSRDGRSPSMRSSSASQSPSHSSSDSHSSSSESFSDSGSSPSHASTNSRSPALPSFSDSLSTPSEDRPQFSACRQTFGPSSSSRAIEGVNLQNINKDDKEVKLSSPKHDQKRPKSHEEGRGGKTHGAKYNEWQRDTGAKACKDTGFRANKETMSGAVKSVRPSPKPNKYLDEHHERESREKRWRTAKHSDNNRDVDRRCKAKHSQEGDRTGAEHRECCKRADTKSEKNRKRKIEDMERREAPNPTERNKANSDRKKDLKKQALQERHIWEEGIKVAPPKKKISININLDGKRKEFDQDLSHSQSVADKTNEETGDGEEGKHKPHTEDVCGEKIRPAETSKTWEKGTFREVKMWEREEKQNQEDFDLWHCALRRAEDGGRHGTKATKEDEVTRDEKRSRTTNERQSQESAELIPNSQEEEPDRKDMFNTNEMTLGELETNAKEELVEMMKQGEYAATSEEQRSQVKSPNAAVDDGSSCEDHQGRGTIVKTLEENIQDTDPEREDVPVHVKVPFTGWDKGSEQVEPEKTAHDALAVSVPPPLVAAAAKQENEEKRWMPVVTHRDRERQMHRRLHNDSSLSGMNRVVAPSSGRYKTDSTVCTDGERKMELERDREKGREGERSRESKRSKERRREEERGRYHNKRDPPASSSSSSMSRDTERRDWQRGGSQGSERKDGGSLSRAVELSDKNAYKTHSDMSADSKSKDKLHPRNCRDQRDASYTRQDGALPSLGQGRDRDPLSSKSFSPKPRASSQEERGKQSKATKGIRESKRNRETDGEGGRRREDPHSNNTGVGDRGGVQQP